VFFHDLGVLRGYPEIRYLHKLGEGKELST
jgi:hypothetical protein